MCVNILIVPLFNRFYLCTVNTEVIPSRCNIKVMLDNYNVNPFTNVSSEMFCKHDARGD